MKRSGAIRTLGPVALAVASAELAVRVLSPREQPVRPEHVAIRDHFSQTEIDRGRRYARPQQAIGLARGLVEATALIALVTLRRARRSETAGDSVAPAVAPAVAPTVAPAAGLAREAIAGALTGAGLSLALSVAGLPLAALARRRALSVGLATQSWRSWCEDLVKAGAIEGLVAGAGGAVLVRGMRRWPQGWWLPAAGGSVVLGAVVATVAPILLDPVFNDFTQLSHGETRADVLALAEAAGVSVGRVYSVDASRRTTAANAYVTGLGPTKRVVLFDTLLERFSRDEIRVVVAHELAHVRHRDVLRGLAFAAITAPATAFAVQRVGSALSADHAGAGSLPALALAAGAVSFPVSLSARRLSRRLERRADAFALELSSAPDAFITFERAIALQNVADIDPPAIASLLSTHPPTGERIGAALAHQKRRA